MPRVLAFIITTVAYDRPNMWRIRFGLPPALGPWMRWSGSVKFEKASKPASSWSVWAVALGDPHRAERPLQFLDKTIEKKVLAKIFGKTFIAEKTL